MSAELPWGLYKDASLPGRTESGGSAAFSRVNSNGDINLPLQCQTQKEDDRAVMRVCKDLKVQVDMCQGGRRKGRVVASEIMPLSQKCSIF